MAKLGGLDIVVANAGIAMYDAADTMSKQSWRDMIDTNLTGVWTVCRGAMPHMIDGGRGGAMVLISSVAIRLRPEARGRLLSRSECSQTGPLLWRPMVRRELCCADRGAGSLTAVGRAVAVVGV